MLMLIFPSFITIIKKKELLIKILPRSEILYFLDQSSFVTQQDFVNIYRPQDRIHQHKLNVLKHESIDTMLIKK